MREQGPRHRILALSLVLAAAGSALMVLAISGWAGAQAKPKNYSRSETLITSGTQWGTIAGFNPYTGNYATGMVGLCNETLLRYDPLADRYINWLAKDARFTSPRTFTVTIRPGVKWSDGSLFTAQDVAWNFQLGRFSTAFWNNIFSNLTSIKAPRAKVRAVVTKKVRARVNGKVKVRTVFALTCKKVKVKVRVKGKTKIKVKRVCKKKYRTVFVPGNKVVFAFAGTPNYAQWQNLLWNLPMIAPQQAKSAITDPASLITYSPNDPIGTGPYALDPEGFDPTTRVVWKKKPVWWAAQQGISPSPKPPYVIDLVTGTCNACDLSGLLTQIEDLDNTYLPGIQGLVSSGQAQTYFPGPPYDLSANTAWLTPNTTRKPLDDKAFRRALAQAININKIVENDYDNLVLPASPTGLLPIWNKWINGGLVASKGWAFSTSAAMATLDAAGYRRDSNGNYQNKDGSPIDLKIAVPDRWSDWEAARGMIITDLAAAHIKAHATFASYNDWQSARNQGAFDLIIDNTYQLSDNPWTFFNGIFHLPIISGGSGQTFANFERYANETAWADVQKLDQTPLENTAARQSLMSELEGILMDDLPLIPLWYNGLWSQSQSKYWTNWPLNGSDRQYMPSMWRGYLQMTGIDMITHLQPVP